jgi:hypothetical protein
MSQNPVFATVAAAVIEFDQWAAAGKAAEPLI